MRTHQRRDHGHWLAAGRCRLVEAARLGGQTAAATLQAVRTHNLLHHANAQALLKTAELTSVSSAFVHRAVLVRQADILGVLLDGSLEEALAALAGADTVVLAGRVIPADGAE